MSEEALRLLDEAPQLTAEDRAGLARRLLNGAREAAEEVGHEWIDEGKRRLDEIKGGTVTTSP